MLMTGPCQDELDKWCAAVKPGEGRLAKCLGGELSVEGQAGHKGARISAACKQELTSFRIQRSTNINMDLPLAKACKADAEKFCANNFEVRRGSRHSLGSWPAAGASWITCQVPCMHVIGRMPHT
jgi:hypothetical protein